MTERETHATNPEIDFEKSDVDAGGLLHFGFWLVLGTGAVILILWRLYFVFVAQEAARQPPAPIMRADPRVMAPPPPLLQRTPAQDLAGFRATEDLILGNYAWIDPSQGLVRLPIEQAIKVVAERGLPVFTAAPAPAASPASGAAAKAAPGAKREERK